MHRLIFILLLCWTSAAWAIVESQEIMPEEFTSQEQKEHFRKVIKDLRCTVCQNQNLADSHASLARDLRRQVLAMMQEGKSDQEIIDFLVNRYGDFVLYNPPLKPSTYMLWILPFVGLVLAILVLLRLIRKRSAAHTRLSNEDKSHLAKSLRESLQDPPEKK